MRDLPSLRYTCLVHNCIHLLLKIFVQLEMASLCLTSVLLQLIYSAYNMNCIFKDFVFVSLNCMLSRDSYSLE
jgi:hypothetical protein